MIIDERTEFADAATITTTATTTAILGDVIDTGGDGINDVEGLYLVIQIDTAVTAAGSETVTFALVSDSTANLATSPTTHWTSPAIAKATLVAGYYVAKIALPKGTYERYLGVTTYPSGTLTAGKANAFLTPNPTTYKTFADAI